MAVERKVCVLLILLSGFQCLLHSYRLDLQNRRVNLVKIKRLNANPVNQDGSNYKDTSENEAFLWFDEAILNLRAGSGGAGSSAMKFGKARQHIGPTGGSGGKGGDIIFVADSRKNTLLGFRGHCNYRAENGCDGDLNYQNGKFAPDLRVPIPLGTTIRDNNTNEIIAEMTEQNQEIIIAKGGKGGTGNAAFSSVNGAKTKRISPEGGESKVLKLELKLVADIGLVGIPNAGKSSLLDAITNAKPKIAAYPFTTIIPNLGVCQMSEFGESMIIADIPGLIEGASSGAGLGKGFLRHIERCKLIVHIINGDSEDPIHDFDAINKELVLYSSKLAKKPQIVVLNKIDLPNVQKNLQSIKERLQRRMMHTRLLCISAMYQNGTKEFVDKTYNFLQKISAQAT